MRRFFYSSYISQSIQATSQAKMMLPSSQSFRSTSKNNFLFLESISFGSASKKFLWLCKGGNFCNAGPGREICGLVHNLVAVICANLQQVNLNLAQRYACWDIAAFKYDTYYSHDKLRARNFEWCREIVYRFADCIRVRSTFDVQCLISLFRQTSSLRAAGWFK